MQASEISKAKEQEALIYQHLCIYINSIIVLLHAPMKKTCVTPFWGMNTKLNYRTAC